MRATLIPSTPSSPPESERVRHRISALWITVLSPYAYGDIFGFFRTGAIKDVITCTRAGDSTA